jgi:hypothetical protein
MSLTVQCAQCHNHKFDPIPQEDYYRLQAVFAALDRADRPYSSSPEVATKLAKLHERQATVQTRLQELEKQVLRLGGTDLAALDRRIADVAKKAVLKPEFGYHSAIEKVQDKAKWVQVDLGFSLAIDKVILWGAQDDFNKIGAGFGFPLRFNVELSDDPEFKTAVLIVDRTHEDVANPGVAPQEFTAGKTGRYVRVTATKLAPRLNDYIFALAELTVLDKSGTNLAARTSVTALDSIEAPPRWTRANLVDGYAPGQATAQELARLRKDRAELLARIVDADTTREMTGLENERTAVEKELKGLPTELVYAGTVYSGNGPFTGTGPSGGKARSIFILRRGDVKAPMKEVSAGALSSVPALPGEFPLPPDHAEGAGRAALARWLTDAKNPLTWRSIVNRVWQYHFGRAIVATPNDFGHMGQLPSHPELLDWLAAEFRDGGQSLKKLHKLIVTSATYRQSSSGNEQGERIDSDNVFLWRMNRQKLEAEAIRDAVLAVAGKLDGTMYGPAYRDFVVEHHEHSPHYEYHLHDPEDAKTFRRTIYRFLVRSKPQPFMCALDCADPSIQVDRRNESVSPLQALALYNDGFMLAMAKHLAERVSTEKGTGAQVTAAFRLALGRAPSDDELKLLYEYAEKNGLANACRVIFNLNEFVFVD